MAGYNHCILKNGSEIFFVKAENLLDAAGKSVAAPLDESAPDAGPWMHSNAPQISPKKRTTPFEMRNKGCLRQKHRCSVWRYTCQQGVDADGQVRTSGTSELEECRQKHPGAREDGASDRPQEDSLSGMAGCKVRTLRYPKSRRHRLQLAPPEEMDGGKWSGSPSRLVISSVNGAPRNDFMRVRTTVVVSSDLRAPAASCISLAQVA